MKKYIAVLAALLCISACGCEAVKITENSSIADPSTTNAIKVEIGGNEDNSPEAEKENAEKAEKEEESKAESDSEAETKAESEAEEEQQADNDGEQLYDEAELKEIAAEQYEKSCEMQWKYLMSCPYELDYDDTVADGNNVAYRVIGADFNDILADYNTVFASNITENGVQTSGDRSAEKLQEKYRVSQYGTYCSDGGRGKNKSYEYTEFEFISFEEEILKLNAISYYTKSSSDTEVKENPFIVVKIDGQWKTWDFTLPY